MTVSYSFNTCSTTKSSWNGLKREGEREGWQREGGRDGRIHNNCRDTCISVCMSLRKYSVETSHELHSIIPE